MNANIILAVGTTTTCQLGNPGDTNWSEATHGYQTCEVLGIEKSRWSEDLIYLIKTEKLVGTAILSKGRYHGVLYCTTALPYNSPDEIHNKAYSLGFNL